MKYGILFSFLIINLSNSLVSQEFPTQILHKKFAEQCLALDSIKYALLSIDYNAAITRFDELEKWSEINNDISLQLTIRLYRNTFESEHEKAADNFETTLLNVIKIAEENELNHVRAEGYEMVANYYWKHKKYAPSLENYLYAHQLYIGFSIDEFPHKADYTYEIGSKYYYFRDFSTAKKYFHEV
ncbi:MAG: hypothetical protein IPM69_18535 [Ignavibacteria bacterium]|nr:hypothetical protein [Ignavibacteria bacterium]